VGCGVSVDTTNQNNTKISGDISHPANAGKLCSKGMALADTLTLNGRLLNPVVNNQPTGWTEATDLIAARLQQTIDDHGPDSVGFYVSGQLLTEDYYVVNKLIKGYIGSANIDTNSRLCMASSVAGHKRAFGSDTVPGVYEDLELANLIILTGSNLAWCHPILQQRITAAKIQNSALTVVVIDPRQTATTELADIHLAIKPDSDSALFIGLLNYLEKKQAIDHLYVFKYTSGIEDAVHLAASYSEDQIETETGLGSGQLNQFYELFRQTEKVVTVYSQGVNQSKIGTDKVNSIINCHLATGRIGRAGMGPFSVTGQPNAMGGREVGGLSNMLAAHMELDNLNHQETVQRFWNSPNIATRPGYKAVELFEAARTGKVKFLWIMATNPVVSMPEANLVKESLMRCPFVVVSDVVNNNDTLRHANVSLPAAAWGEKDGTVTNSERCVSRQRAFRPLSANAKPDWWAVCEVAKKLGYDGAFDYESAADIFREHATLSGFNNSGTRDFDISACGSISNKEYDSMRPFIWPWVKGDKRKTTRFFANGEFYTPDRLGRIIPIALETNAIRKDQRGLVMNTGRVRDQWHTMTRTGHIATLSAHRAEPFIELSRQDAEERDIREDDVVSVLKGDEHVLLRAILTDKQRPGTVFAPMHWTDTHASFARVNTLVSSAVDAVSGQPALKMQRVDIEKYKAASYSYVAIRDKSAADKILEIQRNDLLDKPMYWSCAKVSDGWRYDMASQLTPYVCLQYWRNHLDVNGTEIAEFEDQKKGEYRIACYRHDRLEAAVFVSANPVRSSRHWVAAQLKESMPVMSRFQVIAGATQGDKPDNGPIVCSCFMVGVNQINRCLSEQQCSTVDDIGDVLSAGTNCGSCRGEVQALINTYSAKDSGEAWSGGSATTCI